MLVPGLFYSEVDQDIYRSSNMHLWGQSYRSGINSQINQHAYQKKSHGNPLTHRSLFFAL